MTLLGVLAKHKDHELLSGTRYAVPPGRVYGVLHVTLQCLTCDKTVWDEALGEKKAEKAHEAGR